MPPPRSKISLLLLGALAVLLLWSFFAWLNVQHHRPPALDPPRLSPK